MRSPENQPPGGRLAVLLGRVPGGRAGLPPSLSALRGSDTAKAAGLAGSMIANNLIALVSTVVFARLLKDNQGGGYGSLAALVSYFLILSVVGQALQVATAREGVLGHLGVGADLLATARRWTIQLLAFTAALAVISILLRHQISRLVGNGIPPWGAAVGLPAAGLWLELSILRGVLQSIGDYRGVGLSLIGEQGARLVTGALLAAAGLGVTGAYLGTPLSFVAMGLYCGVCLRRYGRGLDQPAAEAVAPPAAPSLRAPRGPAPPASPAGILTLWEHVKRAWAPIAGLIVIAVLQNIDIIAAKHRFGTSMASSYGAVAVAAKVPIWVAMGAGFYLVPEVSRRRGQGDPTRPILFRALAIVLVCAVPVLLILGLEGRLLIRLVFGANRLQAVGSLFLLGCAFTVLSCTYLAIQYLLALKRTLFLVAVGAVAVAEPILLLNASRHPIGFATVVLAIQAAGAVLAFGLALRGGAPTARGDAAAEPGERRAETATAGVGA